jgi:hypothetical protein
MKWQRIIVLAISITIGSWAVASYGKREVSCGCFQVGEFRLHVRDTEAKPVKGAILHVYHRGTRDLAFHRPFENHREAEELSSDEEGRITVFYSFDGTSFCCESWRLFGVIRMGDHPPQYDCEITATGFKPCRFDYWRLIDSTYDRVPKAAKTKRFVRGEEIDLRVYDYYFVMKK